MKWTKKRRDAKERREQKRILAYSQTLEYQLVHALMGCAGERGYDEGALDTLERIIRERNRAMLLLSLDRMQNFREGQLCGPRTAMGLTDQK